MSKFARPLMPIIACFLLAVPYSALADDFSDCHTGDPSKISNPAFFEKGVRACTRLIAKRSGKLRGDSLGSRAVWLRRLKRFDEAITDIDRALSLSPKNVELYDVQADVWADKGDLDRAIASYDQAIRLDPTYAAAYTSRGEAFEKKGDIEQARASYNAALATPKSRAGDHTGLQGWAHRQASERLSALKATPK